MDEGKKFRPDFEHKFKVLPAQEIIKQVLTDTLSQQVYDSQNATQLSKDLAEQIKSKIKEIAPPKYKIIVQVLIGEQKGQGIAMGSRSFWDNESDAIARETFTNDSLFAVGIVYATYSY